MFKQPFEHTTRARFVDDISHGVGERFIYRTVGLCRHAESGVYPGPAGRLPTDERTTAAQWRRSSVPRAARERDAAAGRTAPPDGTARGRTDGAARVRENIDWRRRCVPFRLHTPSVSRRLWRRVAAAAAGRAHALARAFPVRTHPPARRARAARTRGHTDAQTHARGPVRERIRTRAHTSAPAGPPLLLLPSAAAAAVPPRPAVM